MARGRAPAHRVIRSLRKRRCRTCGCPSSQSGRSQHPQGVQGWCGEKSERSTHYGQSRGAPGMAASLRPPNISSWGSEGNKGLGVRPGDGHLREREKAQALLRVSERPADEGPPGHAPKRAPRHVSHPHTPLCRMACTHVTGSGPASPPASQAAEREARWELPPWETRSPADCRCRGAWCALCQKCGPGPNTPIPYFPEDRWSRPTPPRPCSLPWRLHHGWLLGPSPLASRYRLGITVLPGRRWTKAERSRGRMSRPHRVREIPRVE